MIQVEGLSMAYGGRCLFEEAAFSIQAGERCGLVGRNGSGKTTLFRLLSGAQEPEAGTIVRRKNYSLGVLDQHIAFSQPTLLGEAVLGLRPEDRDYVYKAEKILFGLGFSTTDLELSPAVFSGGYQLRLHLAKILISEPDCLLLDEPTNYLDIVSIRWFTRFLQQWPGEFMLISHDRAFMDAVSTHTMGIHRQKIRKSQGDTVFFFEQILQQEEIHERTRLNQEKKRTHIQSFIDRFGAKATKASQTQSRYKLMQRIPVLEQLKALHHLDFHFKEAPFTGRKMIEAKEVSFSYTQGTQPLIPDFSLTIEKGARLALVGKNGRGKSTLLRLLAGDLAPLSGQIRRADNVAIGYFGQTNIERLHPQATIEEEIAAANSTLTITEVKGICGLMMFSQDQSLKKTHVLSGGEKSRVLLGKILAAPCNLLLLDEPTHHLDMESIEALIDALEDFEGAIVVVTHSELLLERLGLDQIVICGQNSQEVFQGSYEDFIRDRGWQEDEETPKSVKKGAESVISRQQRAAWVAARSQAIKPLDRHIARCETALTKHEVEQQKNHEQMAIAAQAGDSIAIQELSKASNKRQKDLDALYEELEKWLQQREECEATFARQAEAQGWTP